jgi:uncharacterized OsmC-like protein
VKIANSRSRTASPTSTPPAPTATQGVHENPRPLRRHGKALDPKRVEQAVKLSTEKYCSASIMLAKTAVITHDFEVIES